MPLNILWRVKTGTYDRASSFVWNEFKKARFEGATYYVPASSGTNRTVLWRLLGGWDYMDSTVAGEGGYTTKGAIGYPFTNQPLGTAAIVRKFNSTTGDHLLSPSWETVSGYGDEPMSVYGYPRYLNLSTSLLSTSGGGVTAKSNGVAGGAVWEWSWNGTQFINDKDYGRQIQSALFFYNETGVLCNPTEAGDWISIPTTPGRQHGSPVLELQNVSASHAVTRSIPLEWAPESHGGAADAPVIWKDIIMGKDLVLNFNNMGAVAKYSAYLSTPTLIPGAQMEIPTAYLRAEFTRYWTYNAQTHVLTEVFPAASNGQSNVQLIANFGGVIVGNSTATAALGVYGVNVSQGGSVSYFTLWNFTNLGGTGQYSDGTTKWSAVYGPADIPAGSWNFNTYICTGTLNAITAQMDSLFAQGVR